MKAALLIPPPSTSVKNISSPGTPMDELEFEHLFPIHFLRFKIRWPALKNSGTARIPSGGWEVMNGSADPRHDGSNVVGRDQRRRSANGSSHLSAGWLRASAVRQFRPKWRRR